MVACFFVLIAVILGLVWDGGAPGTARAEAGTPPPGLQSHPAAAASDSVLYAVWTDGRLGPEGRLFWTRLEQPVPDTLAGPVTEGGASELRAAVAAGGDWALAAWESWTGTGTRVLAAELPRWGRPGPCPNWEVTHGPGPVWRPAVAVAGETGILLWEDERTAPGDLYFTRWDRGVGPRDAGGVPFATGPEDQRWPRAAAGPQGFLVVWAQSVGISGYQVLAQALDPAGEPVGPPHAVSALVPNAPIPDVTFGGGAFLAAWREDGEGGGDLAGRLLGPTGEPLGPGPFPLAGGPDLEFYPRLAPADTGYALVWLAQGTTGRALRRSWVTGAGEVVPAEGIVLGPPESFCADAALAGWGTRVAAMWRVPLPEDDDDLLWAGYDPAAGEATIVQPLTLVTGTVGVSAPPPPVVRRARPNPFRDAVRLEITEALDARAVEIFDIRGRRVRRLVPDAAGAVLWDGRTDEGTEVVPGVYFARVRGHGAALRLVRIPR